MRNRGATPGARGRRRMTCATGAKANQRPVASKLPDCRQPDLLTPGMQYSRNIVRKIVNSFTDH